MKADSNVQDRIRELLNIEFERRVAEAESRLPSSCVYNHRQPLDERLVVDGDRNPNFNRITREDGSERRALPVVQTIGLCMYGAEDRERWPGTICEDPVDAKRCPPKAFTPKITRPELQEQFETQLKDLSWVQKNLPEVHGLLWVLGADSVPPAPPPPPPEEAPKLVVLSGWAKFCLWLAGLGKHSVYAPTDAVRSPGEGSRT